MRLFWGNKGAKNENLKRRRWYRVTALHSELDTNFNETKISDEISSVLLNNEPRISNILVSVSNPADSHELNVTIQYDITGISSPSQAVDVVLFPARV